MALSLLRTVRLLPRPNARSCMPHRAISGQHLFTEFADLYSADKPHTAIVIKTFEVIHDFSGLPWWGSILAGGFLLRTCACLPFHVLSEINIAKIINTRPKLMEVQKTVAQKATELSGDESARIKLKALRRQGREEVYKSEGCHPLYSIIFQFMQFPVWLTASFALRHLSGIGFSGLPPAPGMEMGGFGWMIDLTLPDPYFILPALVFCLNITNHELNNLTLVSANLQNRGMVVFRRVVSFTVSGGVCLLACFLPQAMILYWFVSSLQLLMLRIAFLYPGVKRLCGVPKTPLDLQRPLHTIWENAKTYPLLRRLKKTEKSSGGERDTTK